MKKDYKIFIVEGEVREPRIIENLKENFFFDENCEIITLPAGQNVYMLWQKMRKENFDIDIVELLREESDAIRTQLKGIDREKFSEVFLFFDYDAHQNNLAETDEGDVIEMMLQSFDNETENGKLYISYPMVEALRDFDTGSTMDKESWFYDIASCSKYKEFSARRACNLDFRKYNLKTWRSVIKSFIVKISFLTGNGDSITYEEYRKLVEPLFIYKKEKNFVDKVVILSAFPEFLLDYFKEEFWDKYS